MSFIFVLPKFLSKILRIGIVFIENYLVLQPRANLALVTSPLK